MESSSADGCDYEGSNSDTVEVRQCQDVLRGHTGISRNGILLEWLAGAVSGELILHVVELIPRD